MNYKKIKSYKDACKALNIEPLSDEVFNAFPKAERENVKAYHQLTVITRAINDGWEPDFKNREQRKYEPYAYTNTAGLAFASTHITPPRVRLRISVLGFAFPITNAPRLP